MTHLPLSLRESESVPFEFNLDSNASALQGETKAVFQKRQGPNAKFLFFYCSSFGPTNSVSVPCFLLSWFVWYKRKDEYKNPEVSLTFLKKLQPGSSAFRGRETLEATDLRTTTGGRDMGQIMFFSLPTHESRALPSSNRKAQKALCGRLGDRAEEERAVQVTHRQVQVCSGTVPRQYDGSFPLIGFYSLSHTGSNPPERTEQQEEMGCRRNRLSLGGIDNRL